MVGAHHRAPMRLNRIENRWDVIELLDAIVDGGTKVTGEDGKKRHVQGGPISANRTLAAVRVLFNWALRRGIIETTPTAMVERPGQEHQRERALHADEICFLWPAFAAVGYPFGTFFQMALLTAQRREEVAGMRWADIDLPEKVWTLPAELTKARRAHVVPLSSPAVEILAGLPRIGNYVFTTAGNRPISGFSKGKTRVDGKIANARKDAGLADLEPWTIHDLRRTVATELARLGIGRLIIAKLLNHSDRSITGIYDRHAYTQEKRHALDTWGQYLSGLLAAPAADNVVPVKTQGGCI